MFGIGVLFILYICLHLAISYDAVKNNPLIKDVAVAGGGMVKREYFDTKSLIIDFGKRLQHTPEAIQWTESTPMFLIGGLFSAFICWLYIITSRKKLITGKEYGTARWAKTKEIKRLFAKYQLKLAIKDIREKKGLNKEQKEELINKSKEKYTDADMIFTMTERICIYNYELNNNTFIIGGAGAGKTRGYVMPNILQAHSSFVITDPKGEILEKSGHFLKNVMGYKLRVLNLFEKTLSSGYNPFVYLHKEREGWEERVLSLIETIIINTDGGQKANASEPFWEKGEKLFVQSIFFAVLEAFPKEEANINTALELVSWLKIEEDNDTYDSDLDIFFQCFEDRYGSEHIAVQQYSEFRQKASGKTAKSIVISAVVRLAPFKIKEVKRIVSYDDMHLDSVGEEKTAVFVIVPPIDTTYNFIAGMLFTQLFQELNYCALNVHKKDGMRLPVPVRFILDEFANTCNIPNFINILAYARSLGIGITPILQSLEQAKKMYKDDWGVMIDNCDTLLYLGKVSHMDTLKYLSESLGKGTYDKKSSSRTKGRQSSTSVSSDKIGRDLLDPSEIQKMKKNKCLLFVSGESPFYSKKYNYKKHKNYKYTSDGNKKYSFSYKPDLPTNLSTHGEENENRKVEFKDLKVEFDQTKVLDTIMPSMAHSDFDNDELVVVNDGEHSELTLFAELEKEENNIDEAIDNILSSVIEINMNPKTIIKTGIELATAELSEDGSVDFDNIEVNDGENLIDEEIEEEIEVELGDDLDNLNDIVEDMNNFLDDLNSLDLDAIESEDMTTITLE